MNNSTNRYYTFSTDYALSTMLNTYHLAQGSQGPCKVGTGSIET